MGVGLCWPNGDERNEDVLGRAALGPENVHAVLDPLGLGLGERIVGARVFHLAEVQKAVGAVDDEVDLGIGIGALAAPRVVFGEDAVHAYGA